MKRILILLLTLGLLVSACGADAAEMSLTPDIIVAELEGKFPDTDSIQYDFSYSADETVYYMYVSNEDLCTFAMMAMENEEYRETWNELSDRFVKLNETATKLLRIYSPDPTVTLATMLRDVPTNEKIVYAVLDSKVIYDPVNGILPEASE